MRDDDLTLDESAELELKKMAHTVIQNEEATAPKSQSLMSISESDQASELGGDDVPKQSDNAISRVLSEAEMDDTLSEQENEKNEKLAKESMKQANEIEYASGGLNHEDDIALKIAIGKVENDDALQSAESCGKKA